MEGKSSHSSPSTIISPPAPKRTKGRQKIEMKRIEKKDRLNVTFSKRHNGLFKKAKSLCKLFNIEMVILVLSSAGRPHNWGYPSLRSVIDRYVGRNVHGHIHESQEEGKEESPHEQNQGDDELQNLSIKSQSNSCDMVDGQAQLVKEGTTSIEACTRDFLAEFL